MKRSICFLVLLSISLFCSIAHSQTSEVEWTTRGWANGRYWQGLSDDSKIQHLYGVEAGLNLFAEELSYRATTEAQLEQIEKLRDELMVGGFRFSDVAQQVDRFYQDSANILIPVDYAYLYSVKKMRGENPDQLQEYLASLRKKWNK